MSKVEFAPIVYGRTYEVDFRFIVVPEDFQQSSQPDFQLKDRDWLEDCIHSTTHLAERLPEQPRWSIFKNESHCIVGVTCMAAEVSSDKTKDKESRPLYVFLGHVFRPPAGFQPIPMVLDDFKKLYNYVSKVWEAKPYDLNSRVPTLAPYQEISGVAESKDTASISLVANSNELKLNFEPNKVYIWTDLAEFRQKLWLAASVCQQPVSLCLGLPNEAAALNGRFLNGTIQNFNIVRELYRRQHLQQRQTSDQRPAASLNNVDALPSIQEEQQEPQQRKLCNQDTESQQNESKYLPDHIKSTSGKRADRSQKDSNILSGIRQIGQGVIEFLRGDDLDNDEDYRDSLEEQVSPSQVLH